jgi:hypothetical protein
MNGKTKKYFTSCRRFGTWPETRLRKITPDNAIPDFWRSRICTGNGAAFTNRVLSGRRLEDKRNRTFSHDEKSPSPLSKPQFNRSPVFRQLTLTTSGWLVIRFYRLARDPVLYSRDDWKHDLRGMPVIVVNRVHERGHCDW